MSALLQKNKTKNRDSNIYPSKISWDLFLNVFAMFFECNKHTCCQWTFPLLDKILKEIEIGKNINIA